MSIVIILLIIGFIVEIILINLKKSILQEVVTLLMGLLSLTIAALFILDQMTIWSLLFLYLACFRIINNFRLIYYSKQPDYLRSVYKRTLSTLSIGQLILVTIAISSSYFSNNSNYSWTYVLGFSLVVSGIVAFKTFYNYRLLRSDKLKKKVFLEKNLPSISVLIPARNEDQQLRECLDSVIRSDYPKLEILVLDDCSQTRRTADIIKEYAHEGVIFIQGETPPETFAAKNYAYQQLFSDSNGEIVFFMGVDARLGVGSLREVVEELLISKKRMLSVLPLNQYVDTKSISPFLIQPLRYFWELGLPRKFLKQPPVLSTFWGIFRSDLESYGAFQGLRRDILPERSIAKHLVARNSYEFILKNNGLEIISKKSFNDQRDTAIRLKYPSLKQRLESLSLVVAFKFMVFLLPILELVVGIFTDQFNLIVFGIVLLGVGFLSYVLSSYFAYRRFIPKSFVLAPFAICHDIYLDLRSMLQYEFGEVYWKGRKVCIPVMHSIDEE